MKAARYTLYVPENEIDNFDQAERIARINRTSVSAVVLVLLRGYTKDNKHLLDAVDRATKKKGVKNGR